MRYPRFASLLATLWLLSHDALAQHVDLSSTKGLTFIEGTKTQHISEGTAAPTGSYASYKSRITLSASAGNYTSVVTGKDGSAKTTITGVISATGGSTTLASNMTATSSSAPKATNTRPCNGYVDFCSRRYSNVTVVGCHNSPFVRPGNSASNQDVGVAQQLDDGVRFLQAQIQWPTNGSVPHFCHTSCDIFDAGPITNWLGQVKSWVDSHPYDVVTILLGNGNYSEPSLYAPFIEQTGILKYAYEPPYLPMGLDDWPTLENMVLRGKRVVMFMDYMANQLKYPWLLDEFSQVFETPFDPVNRKFPCTAQRPPNLGTKAAEDRLYIMNHNLNADFKVFGTELLVPAVSLLNQTNAVSGFGSLGLAANNCRSSWDRPPTVLNVDYYNYGNFPCSVFEVAARSNNVTFHNLTRCGMPSGASALGALSVSWALVSAVALCVLWML